MIARLLASLVTVSVVLAPCMLFVAAPSRVGHEPRLPGWTTPGFESGEANEDRSFSPDGMTRHNQDRSKNRDQCGRVQRFADCEIV